MFQFKKKCSIYKELSYFLSNHTQQEQKNRKKNLDDRDLKYNTRQSYVKNF